MYIDKESNIINNIIKDDKVIGKCCVCDKIDYKYNNKLGRDFCSWSCYEAHKTKSTKPNCNCVICNKEFYLKPYRLKRVKHGVVCSDKCKSIQKSNLMIGSNNHQYNVKGENNASFKGDEILNQYGYIKIYIPNHPKCDTHGRYLKHRYIVENSNKFDNIYFNIIDRYRVLKSKYIVHHKNEVRTDNTEDNLEILTKSKHTSIHNNTKAILRDKLGRIIGVVKSRELLGSLEEDNQQPSLSSNTFKGSTTNSRIQTDNAEDSNADTSAGQFRIKF